MDNQRSSKRKSKSLSRRSILKKITKTIIDDNKVNNIIKQETLRDITKDTNLDTIINEMFSKINTKNDKNTKVIRNFLNKITNNNKNNFYNDIVYIVSNYQKDIINFQSAFESVGNNELNEERPIISDYNSEGFYTISNKYKIYLEDQKKNINKTINSENYETYKKYANEFLKNFKIIKNDIFGKYKLWEKEGSRNFITIDPTIIQIMIFDTYNKYQTNDIVYSLKLIIREKGELTIRYTTQLFPEGSEIIDFSDLTNFDKFNISLDKSDEHKYINEKDSFLKTYIKFYNLYKKCYLINNCNGSNKKLIDYQLKYISILGKARFGKPEIQTKTLLLTDYIMSNVLFANPTYAFISGGYKGFKSNKFGITRSGYEIAKKYNRPILTIMCKEGLVDSHEYSDATLIYGEHWGEDTIALSQFTDGAIIIAPFGGWTYIECLALLAKKKIVGIYNGIFNILDYDIKNSETIVNEYFFDFTITEQCNIIDYYINYYLILLGIAYKHDEPNNIFKTELTEALKIEIILLTYFKEFLTQIKIKNNKLNSKYFLVLIEYINILKEEINNIINDNDKLENINTLYSHCCNSPKTYQDKIPKFCDGIWIKPQFDLISLCSCNHHDYDTVISNIKEYIEIKSYMIKGGTQKLSKIKYNKDKDPDSIICTNLSLDNDTLSEIKEKINNHLDKYSINIETLKNHPIFKNLNNNIIFVFSNVTYLNIYLNQNLNAISTQNNINKKNSQLLKIQQKTSADSAPADSAPADVILERYISDNVRLKKSLDGQFDLETNQIVNENIVKNDYDFIIDSKCIDYNIIIS